MNAFEQAFQKVLEHEGVHSNDPVDPGGDTWYGISRRSHPNIPWPPSLEEARTIYRVKYWNKVSGDLIAAQWGEMVAGKVFDIAVNMGVSRAVDFWNNSVGRDTRQAKYDSLCREQGLHYLKIAAANPSQRKFLRGWMIRAMACLAIFVPPTASAQVWQPSFGLTNEQDRILEVAVALTVVDDSERFACLLGNKLENVVRVDSIFAPTQFAYKGAAGFYVDAELCPAGTVADFHTHPLGAEVYPSDTDMRFWATEHRYDIHLIGHVVASLAGPTFWIQEWIRVPGTDAFTILTRKW